MDVDESKRRSLPLIVVCVLLCISSVLCLADMAFVLQHVQQNTFAFAPVFVGVITFFDALLRIALVIAGVRLLKERRPDTSDDVNKCQSLAIAAAGFCAIDWIVDALADNAIDRADLVETIVALVIIFIYYRLVKRMEHTTFWDGIRHTPRLVPFIAVGDIATELTIDGESGRLRSVQPGETPCVTVLTIDEYLDHASARVIQQILPSLNNVRRSSCIQFGDIVVGNVCIPAEVQRAAGFDSSKDLGFSYQFSDGCLVLVMDEDGPERAFLAQTLVDQYLEKSTGISLIPEMVGMLAMRVSDWVRVYEDRLARLESNLNDDVYEMPKGFSEFISNARRELGVMHGFCRQTGDMLEDLTQVATNSGYERAAYNCSTIARHIARLASDADDVRDFAGEIRAGYQERIEVRQNKVMSMLTIVETVFTPLALVTGWYGMNFINMPELKHPDAYFIVAGILVFFIAIEFAVFKRRRWF